MNDYSEILKKLCNCSENDNIKYRPYEHSRTIQNIQFRDALKMFKKDVEEMKTFMAGCGVEDEEKAMQCTCSIWKKHIVIF